MNSRELATILGALRMWQRYIDDPAAEDRVIDQQPYKNLATNNGRLSSLDSVEIDVLCERLNLGDLS